jgi:hypothetical protein
MTPLQTFADEPLLRTDLIKSDIDVPAHEVVQVRVDFPRCSGQAFSPR